MHHGSGVRISSVKLTLIEVKGRNVSRSKAENGSRGPRPPRKLYKVHSPLTYTCSTGISSLPPPRRRVDLEEEGFIVVGGEANKDCEESRRVL